MILKEKTMTKRLLSVHICTLPEREKSFNKLLNELYRQRDLIPNGKDLIEIVFDDAPRGVLKIGGKRNGLRKQTTGAYCIDIDDDDVPSPNYLQLIMEGCYSGKDIITFSFDYYIDGIYSRTMIMNRFLPDGNNHCSKHWAINYNPTHRYTIMGGHYHLCAVKRELADQVSFIDENNMEDVTYSKALIPLIQTEFHIEHTLLTVYFDTKKIQNV